MHSFMQPLVEDLNYNPREEGTLLLIPVDFYKTCLFSSVFKCRVFYCLPWWRLRKASLSFSLAVTCDLSSLGCFMTLEHT